MDKWENRNQPLNQSGKTSQNWANDKNKKLDENQDWDKEVQANERSGQFSKTAGTQRNMGQNQGSKNTGKTQGGMGGKQTGKTNR